MIGQTNQKLEKIVKELEKEFKVTDKVELTGFLGIDVKRSGNKFRLFMPTLIKKIMNLAGLQGCKPNKVPAAKELGLMLEPLHLLLLITDQMDKKKLPVNWMMPMIAVTEQIRNALWGLSTLCNKLTFWPLCRHMSNFTQCRPSSL
jgi:hypothetical protein